MERFSKQRTTTFQKKPLFDCHNEFRLIIGKKFTLLLLLKSAIFLTSLVRHIWSRFETGNSLTASRHGKNLLIWIVCLFIYKPTHDFFKLNNETLCIGVITPCKHWDIKFLDIYLIKTIDDMQSCSHIVVLQGQYAVRGSKNSVQILPSTSPNCDSIR